MSWAMPWSCRRAMISSFGSTSVAPSAASGADANIDQNNSVFTSALYGRANGDATVGATGGGTSTFASDVSLRARDMVPFLSGNAGSTVTVGGNLTLSANADGVNARRFGERRVGRVAGL